jgi:hypothetical protein
MVRRLSPLALALLKVNAGDGELKERYLVTVTLSDTAGDRG